MALGLSSRFWFALLLSLAAADRASAQTWRLEPSLSVSERYDDNVQFVPVHPEADTVTTVTPGLTLTDETKALRWGVNYSATVERFARHPDLNNVAHNATLNFGQDHLFGSPTTSLALNDAFRSAPELLVLQQTVPPPGSSPSASIGTIQTPRGKVWTNAAELTVAHQFTERFTQQIGYRNELTRYELPMLIDSDIHEGRFESTYRLDPIDSIGGLYRYRYFDFFQKEGDPNAVSHAFLIRFKHWFGPSVSMTADAGMNYSFQASESPARAKDLIGGLNFSKSGGRLELRADYTRDVGLAGGLSAKMVATQTVSADVAYALIPDLRALVTGGLSDSRSLVDRQTDILSWTVGAGLSYQLLRWLSAEIRYSHFGQRTTTGLGKGMQRNQYILTVTARASHEKSSDETREDESERPEGGKEDNGNP